MPRRFLILAFILIFLLLPSISSPARAQDADQLAKFKQSLEKAGFLVQEGSLYSVDTYKALCNYNVPSGWGFNMSSPYAVTDIPMAPDQTSQNYFAFHLPPEVGRGSGLHFSYAAQG